MNFCTHGYSLIQKVREEITSLLVHSIKKETGIKNICLGGVALNCVSNGKLLDQGISNIWIQPAAGDAGNAIGAALVTYYEYFNKKREVVNDDSMSGTYLGPCFSNQFIKDYLNKIEANYKTVDDKDLFEELARSLEEGKVIGWFNGRMNLVQSFGARSIGRRSKNKNIKY